MIVAGPPFHVSKGHRLDESGVETLIQIDVTSRAGATVLRLVVSAEDAASLVEQLNEATP